MDEFVKEGREKFEQSLRKYKVAKIASLISRKTQLEEEIKKVDADIQEVKNMTFIPECVYIRD